jgi:hypothetical protein
MRSSEMAYVEVTLKEMETFLKRGFRALRPEQGLFRGQILYDLSLSPSVVIRIYTSIMKSGYSAGAGGDSMRVVFLGVKVDKPLVGGSFLVKRTNSWRNTLQDKIEEYLELYEEKAEYWDQRGNAEPGSKGPSASDKQVRFIMSMAARATEEQIVDAGLDWPVDPDAVKDLTSKEASNIITILLSHGLGNRYASDQTAAGYGSDQVADIPVPDHIAGVPISDVRNIVRATIQKSGCEGSCDGVCDGTCGTECTCEGSCTCGERKTSSTGYNYDFS